MAVLRRQLQIVVIIIIIIVNNFAHIAKPLSDLTKKSLPDKITWTDIPQEAFDTLKEEIHKNLILHTFDVTKPFNLYCDSSDCAVGAVLTQQDNCGVERPISFIDR